jgi:Tfp pilus assembly protein PilF
LGYAYLKLGDPGAAADSFARALDLDPGDGRTALQMGYALLAAGRPADARETFGRLRLHPDVVLKEAAETEYQRLRKQAAGAVPADAPFEALGAAYRALAVKDYDAAIAHYKVAVQAAPRRPSLRKELGYTYLKAGETLQGREAFEEALLLDPADERASLELAFLFHETGEVAKARGLFAGLMGSTDAGVEAAAAQAFASVDGELQRSIGRWVEAVQMDPLNRSAQLELAELYEKQGQPQKAIDHYLAALVIPSEKSRDEILLGLGRARQAAGDPEGAVGAWLIASRSNESRTSVLAREKLPARFPYASEFRRALALDPEDTLLRRDLAYLLLEIGWTVEARTEFEIICRKNPDDLLAAAQLAFLYLEEDRADSAVALLEDARESSDPRVARKAEDALKELRERQANPHRALGEKSLRLSYLNDARREFERAFELNPNDTAVALKLGIVNNLLKRDREALNWFRIASASGDPAVAEQARQSHENLAPLFKPVTTTVWSLPFFSSRFRDVFHYAQVKTEFRLGGAPIRPYLSLRFSGDARRRTGGEVPQFLSESSVIAGVGLRTVTKHGVTVWGEAGEAFSYSDDRPPDVPRAGPDYRGGLNYFRNFGASLGAPNPGRFAEVNFDAVYLSRFDDNAIAYWQFRPGYRLPGSGDFRAQVFLNFNVTADRNRAYWANYAEFGPGIRIRIPRVDPPMDFTISAVRGVHLANGDNPRRPNYYDIRVGLWYSFAK